MSFSRVVRSMQKYLFLPVVLALISISGDAHCADRSAKQEAGRAKILAHIIHAKLESGHFSNRKLDDSISETAFGLYLKQLDPQKRILLQEDVDKLRKYEKQIDDQLISSDLELALKGSTILSVRAAAAHSMVKEILSGDPDFSDKEYVETDPEKIGYCKTKEELKERWRKILKLEVLSHYINLTEEQKANAEKESGKEGKKQTTEKERRKSARDKVLKAYNQFFSRIAKEKESEKYERLFIALTHAYDPHTDYMPPMDKEAFDISMRGSLEGIGATLKEDDGQIKVVSIMPGSPASKQGQLQPEDIILKVAEGDAEAVDISGMKISEAVRLIRGKKGTEVRLTIKKPDQKILTISIIRDIIQIEETFVKAVTVDDKDSKSRFGYIKIPSFYRDFEKTSNGGKGRNSTDDVKAELAGFGKEGIKGLVIDLRNNGGGALTDAVKIAGLFFKTGPVVQVKNSDGSINTLSDTDPEVSYSGPVVVLVNRISASASEILAGALQNYGRAVIIGGEHTHGKGTVQSILDLNNVVKSKSMEAYKPLGALKLTIQKFYRINGDSTQYRGVIPDITLPDTMSGLKTGEQYLDFALPWDTVKPVAYTSWQKCGPELRELKEKSVKRTKSDQEFIDMENRAARLAEKQKKTLKPLNLEEAQKDYDDIRKQDKDPKTSDSHAKKEDEAKTPEEKKAALLKSVSADNYVKEAISVIKDIITSDPACISINVN